MRKKQIRRIIIVLIMLLIVLGFGLFVLPKLLNNTPEEVKETIEPQEEIVEEVKEDHWLEYYEINGDYIGHVYFESNLVNLPFVQGDTNETYYRTDWETLAYDEEGSVFLDYRNDINSDQNIIIYGHTVYESYEPSKTHKFTPLHKLIEKDNYEENKYLYLDLKDRIEKYQVAIVYRCKIDVDGNAQYVNPAEPKYYLTTFSDEEFNEYISLAKDREYYDTGVDINYDDKMLTFQTCYEGTPDKLIITSKLIETIYKNSEVK